MPCFPSLSRAEKNSSALQGRWLEEPEGFPAHVSFREGNKRVVTPLRMANKTAIMAAARRTEGSLRPRGCETPPPLRGSSPCKAGQFIPGGFDCRHSEVCKSRNSVLLNSFF